MKIKILFRGLASLLLVVPVLVVYTPVASAVPTSSVQGGLQASNNQGKTTASCGSVTKVCDGFSWICASDGSSKVASVAKPGDESIFPIGATLWEGNAPGCKQGMFARAIYGSSKHLVECLDYYQVYRFYGTENNFDQFISSSKITPVNDCQNMLDKTTSTTEVRLANPNPGDASDMPIKSPWNSLNITAERITNQKNTASLISVGSDGCINSAKRLKDGACPLTTGKAAALSGNTNSCSNLYVPAADNVKSYVNSTTKVNINGKLVELGSAVRDRIFSIIEPYLTDSTYASANKLVSGWLPYNTLTGLNPLPATASDITSLGNKLDCSSLLQYIPTLQPNTTITDKNNFSTCVVGVGTLADHYLVDGDSYFQHHGSEILNGAYTQKRYMDTTLKISEIIGISDLTTYKKINPVDVLNKSSRFKEYITSKGVNGQVNFGSISEFQLSQQSSMKGTSSDRLKAFGDFAECYQVTMNTSIFTIPDETCPDGSAIPASGVCGEIKIICPDGSNKPAGGTCPVTPLTPSACTGNPCINVNLDTPKQFVVGGTLRPQKVTATATYANISKCGHFICRASSNAATNITLNLTSTPSGGYTMCNTPITNPKMPAGCSYTQAISNSNGNNKATIDYQFFSAANPGEKITITATAAGFYDYADQVQDPCVDRTFRRGSVLTTICVFPPKRTVWTYNSPISSFAQSPTGSSTVIGTVGN